MNARVPACALNAEQAQSQISALWDAQIVPQLQDYIRIPAKSPLFDADWAREKELAADTFAAGITSCEIMHALIRNHLDGAMAGYNNPDDPHPHPDARLKAAGTCA